MSGRNVEYAIRALQSQISGQHIAVEEVAKTLVARMHSELDGSSPLCIFLFVGPSGTGKSTLAAAIARYVFGRDDARATVICQSCVAMNALYEASTHNGLHEFNNNSPRVIEFMFIEEANDGVLSALRSLCSERGDSPAGIAFPGCVLIFQTSSAIWDGYLKTLSPDRELWAQDYRNEFINSLPKGVKALVPSSYVIFFDQLARKDYRRFVTIEVSKIIADLSTHPRIASLMVTASAEELISESLPESPTCLGWDLHHLINDQIRFVLADALSEDYGFPANLIVDVRTSQSGVGRELIVVKEPAI